MQATARIAPTFGSSCGPTITTWRGSLWARAQARLRRTSAASGKIVVSVQVGANGSVCSASISNDTVGSGEISSCVLNRFRNVSLPPPEKGCVTLNVPINFKIAE